MANIFVYHQQGSGSIVNKVLQIGLKVMRTGNGKIEMGKWQKKIKKIVKSPSNKNVAVLTIVWENSHIHFAT